MINQKHISLSKDINNLRLKKKYQGGSGNLEKENNINILPIEKGLPQISLPEQEIIAKKHWKQKHKESEQGYLPRKERKALKFFFPARERSLQNMYNENKETFLLEQDARNILAEKPYDRSIGADKYMSNLSQEERDILSKSETWNKISKSYLDMIEQGILSSSPSMGRTIPGIKNKNYTASEARETTPIDIIEGVGGLVSKPLQGVSNAVGITNFKKADNSNYTVKDALQGKQNDAGLIADAVTDLTNFVGIGLGKSLLEKGPNLLKAGKSHIADVRDAFNYNTKLDLRNRLYPLQWQPNNHEQFLNWQKQNLNNIKNRSFSDIESDMKNDMFYRLTNASQKRQQEIADVGMAPFIKSTHTYHSIPSNIMALDNGILVQTPSSDVGSKFIQSKAVKLTDKSKPQTIFNFRTGEEIPINVSYSGSKSGNVIYSVDSSKKLVDDAEDNLVQEGWFNMNPQYIETLNDNMRYIAEQFPGSKPIGSSVGITEGGLVGATNDIDLIMTRDQYIDARISKKYPGAYRNGPAIAHTIDSKFGESGKIDVNIIESDAYGMGEGELATELFRQFFPDDFYKANQEAIKLALKEGKSFEDVTIKINKTAQELLDAVDPVIKTIMDSYETGPSTLMGFNQNKIKHINRIDFYINYGDIEKVKEAQLKFTQSIVGSKGDVGKQFPISEFSDVEKNKKILEKIEFIGDIDKVAKEPERMQLALNDHYINNSIYNRQVQQNSQFLKTIDNVIDAFITWKGLGGNAMGAGLNTVKLGFPDHYATGLLGSKQFKLYDDSVKNIDDYLFQIKRKTSGEYQFSDEELKIIKEIGDKYSINTERVKQASHLLSGDKSYDTAIYQPFLKEIGETLKTKAIATSDYGNSLYSTDLGYFDKQLDNLAISLHHQSVALKSFEQRKKQFSFKPNQGDISSIDTKEEFYKLRNLLDNGLKKANKRRLSLNVASDNLITQRNKLINETLHSPVSDEKLIKFKEQAIRKIEKEIEVSVKELNDMNNELNELTIRSEKLENLYKIYSIIGGSVTGIGTAAIGGLGVLKVIQKINENENSDIFNRNDLIKDIQNNKYLPKSKKEIVKFNARRMLNSDIFKNSNDTIKGQLYNKAFELNKEEFKNYIDSLNANNKQDEKINTSIINNIDKHKYGGNMNKKLAIRKKYQNAGPTPYQPYIDLYGNERNIGADTLAQHSLHKKSVEDDPYTYPDNSGLQRVYDDKGNVKEVIYSPEERARQNLLDSLDMVKYKTPEALLKAQKEALIELGRKNAKEGYVNPYPRNYPKPIFQKGGNITKRYEYGGRIGGETFGGPLLGDDKHKGTINKDGKRIRGKKGNAQQVFFRNKYINFTALKMGGLLDKLNFGGSPNKNNSINWVFNEPSNSKVRTLGDLIEEQNNPTVKNNVSPVVNRSNINITALGNIPFKSAQEFGQSVNNYTNNLKDSLKVPEDVSIKSALKSVESSGKHDVVNDDSGAAGLYQFVQYWHENAVRERYGIPWKQFVNDPVVQEDYMNHWLYTTLIPTATQLQKKYPNSNLSIPQLVALVHFQGPKGAEKQIKEEAMDQYVGKNVINSTDYIKKFTKVFDKQNKS